MAHLRTLVFTPAPTVERQSVTLTSAVEFDSTGTFHVFNRAARPIYRFKLSFDALSKTEVDCLTGLHHYLQSGKSFLWDGGNWGRLDNYTLVAEGNSQQQQFFLPNRYIGVSSLRVRSLRAGANSVWAVSSSNGWPYSLNANPGVLVFANSSNTIPASGDDVQAQYGCQYRVHFDPGGIIVREIARQVYAVELGLIETGFVG